MITISFLFSIMFFGGWYCPLIASADSAYAGAAIIKIGVLLTKVFAFICFIMLIRWTIPRFRYDQLMSLAWKTLIPLSMLNVVLVMCVKQFGLPTWLLTASSLGLAFAAASFYASLARNRLARGSSDSRRQAIMARISPSPFAGEGWGEGAR